MQTIAQLKSSLPQVGKIDWISIRPQKKKDVKILEEVEVTVKYGLAGDHYSKEGGDRMITLIQKEHITSVGSFLRKEVDPGLLRRNIVVEGINLNALQDAMFKIGDNVILEGTGFCHPCSRMEQNLGEGGYNAMRGHGGITARVLHGGHIKKGDRISLVRTEGRESHI